MSDYLSFVYGGISQSCSDALADGKELARKCLRELAQLEQDRFPPRLLILLASPAYLDQQKAEQLLRGVHETFSPVHPGVELIGSSVGGVFFDRRVHPEGALLMCLASKLVKAQVACGRDARRNPKHAIKALLRDLKLDNADKMDPNPLANRLILTFLPGCKEGVPGRCFYPAPELHQRLYEGAHSRIWMVGGVSSANDRSRTVDGWQCAGDEVLRDSVVAASIETGVPIGVSLNDVFDNSDMDILHVTELDKHNRRMVLKFDGQVAQERLDTKEVVMLAKLSAAGRIVDVPLPKPGGGVQLLRPVKRGDYFKVLRPGTRIFRTVWDGLEQARKRVYVRNPVAGLLFPCKSYNPRTEEDIGAVESTLIEVEKRLGGKPCVGGFFDGELGVDETGRSRLTNGGVGYAILGDEMRERTPLYRGVSALAEHGPELLAGLGKQPRSISATIDRALTVIDQTGFPGAMVSLFFSTLNRDTNTDESFLVAQKAIGLRFPKIVDETKRSSKGDDILVRVSRVDEPEPIFIPDSRDKDSFCEPGAIERSGIVSQYILPLKRQDASVFGTLQVDLGDLSKSKFTHEDFSGTEWARMLNCFAAAFSAAILSVADSIENRILMGLDKALNDSLSADNLTDGLKIFFQGAGEAFGVEMGHLWLVKTEGGQPDAAGDLTLVLETGFGVWYDVERESRREIRSGDLSPIDHAINSDIPQIVNDVEGDTSWKAVLESVPSDSELAERLKLMKSYAAVAVKDVDGKTLGALNFGSTKPWFFLKVHREALKVLADRLTFLVEHLKAKTQRDFFFKVSPELVKQKLEDTEQVLQHVTEKFRDALKAQVASLYLWDKDRRKYILRAQSGWVTGDAWVGAASYRPGDGWIGVTAINRKPLHEPDLREYYLTEQRKHPEGRYHPEGLYARYMFGKPMSETFTVEAVGLPLQIGPKRKDKFGVLTLYREVGKDDASGFVTIDLDLLQEGAYNVAGLVNAVLRRSADMWDQYAEKRRQEVYQGIGSPDDAPFEEKICREVLKAYRATTVDFYLIKEQEEGEGKLAYSWIAGYQRRPGSDPSDWSKLRTPSENHSQIINETKHTTGNRGAYRVAFRRRVEPEGREPDLPADMLDGLVEHVCIPLIGDKEYLAALVIRWTLSPKVALSLDVQHDVRPLRTLGNMLGSAYLRRRLEREAKRQALRSDLAVKTAGVYVFQHAHKLGSAVMRAYRLAQEVKEADDEEERRRKIEELEATATNNTKLIEWVINLGELVQNPECEPQTVYELVQESLNDIVKPGYAVEFDDITNVKETSVFADARLMKEVFINLYNNAVKAMENKTWAPGEGPKLKVDAVVSPDEETVQIIFEDNGVGMTPRHIDDAEKGFVLTERESLGEPHKGVGVLISRYLLQVQDGSLKYDRVNTAPGKGTVAVVTLPHYRGERSKRWNGRP